MKKQLIMDTRENKTEKYNVNVVKDLERNGFTVIHKALPTGDYLWESRLGTVLIERKTPDDLRGMKRFRAQLARMRELESEYFPILLIDHRPIRWNNWAKRYTKLGTKELNDLDNLLLSVQGRVRVAHCDAGALATRLSSLYDWTNKPRHQILVRSSNE